MCDKFNSFRIMTVKNTEGLIIVRILFLKKLILLDFLKFKFRLFYSIMADKNRELSSVKKSYLFFEKRNIIHTSYSASGTSDKD